MNIRRAGRDDLPVLAAFYQACGYRAPLSADAVNLMLEQGTQLLAAVRLCREGGVMVLRGMQVCADVQRKGLGRQLLQACTPYLDDGVAYCLPYAHLQAFYGAVGFQAVGLEALPDFLAQRLRGYLGEGQAIIAMRRTAEPH